MGRVANTALAARWRERLGRWRGSRLSVAEFCRREGISQPSFYQWRKRLQRQPANAGSSRFVELPLAPWPGTTGVQVTLPSGAVVAIPGHASSELVAAVVRAAMLAPREDLSC